MLNDIWSYNENIYRMKVIIRTDAMAIAARAVGMRGNKIDNSPQSGWNGPHWSRQCLGSTDPSIHFVYDYVMCSYAPPYATLNNECRFKSCRHFAASACGLFLLPQG